MEYMQTGSERVWSANRVELDLSPVWIFALLNVDSAKKEKVWIANSGGRFLMTGTDCLRLCVHNNFEAVASGRCPGLFMIVTAREGAVFGHF